MSKDLAVQIDEMQQAVELLVKGNSPTAISKKMGISRAKVLEYLDANRKFALENVDLKERSRELMLQIDQHYTYIINKFHYVIDEAERTGELKEMTSALKGVAQVEKDRTQLYRDAGMTADDDLAEQLAMMEAEHEQIKQILKDVSAGCPRCKAKVHQALSAIKGAPEVIVVEEPRAFEDVPD